MASAPYRNPVRCWTFLRTRSGLGGLAHRGLLGLAKPGRLVAGKAWQACGGHVRQGYECLCQLIPKPGGAAFLNWGPSECPELYIYMSVNVNINMYVYIHIHICTRIFVCICIYICIGRFSVYMDVCVCMCVCIEIE